MTARFETIITGCDLCGPGFIAHGDLWEFGDTWIFNAVGDERLWEGNYESEEFHPTDKRLTLDYELNYWERRGVFILQRDTSLLNWDARAYLGLAE